MKGDPGLVHDYRILSNCFSDKLQFTSWDVWEVHGNKNYTLKEFVQYFKVNCVMRGVFRTRSNTWSFFCENSECLKVEKMAKS